MKKTLKGFIAGVVVTSLVFSSCMVTFAAVRQLKADFTGAKLVVDGKDVIPKDAKGNKIDLFSVEGTTYLPVRAIGDALGKEVSWDGATKTVYIGAKPNEVKAYSRTNPAPIGVTQNIASDGLLSTYNADVTVTQVISGNEAWGMIKGSNQFNSPAEEGYEYLLVKIKVKVNSVKDDKSFNINSYSFDVFTKDNAEYIERSMVVVPEPVLGGQMYSGSEKEGWMSFYVKSNDAPKIVFGKEYDGSGGIWFNLK